LAPCSSETCPCPVPGRPSPRVNLGLNFSSRRFIEPRHTPPPGLAFGAPDDRLQRGIQHAATSRFHRRRLGILDRPVEVFSRGRAMTVGRLARTLRRGHCERKRSNPSRKEELDCFVASAPRNDVDGSRRDSTFSRHHAPEFCKFIPRKNRGGGSQDRRLMLLPASAHAGVALVQALGLFCDPHVASALMRLLSATARSKGLKD
jgi:hypothetical protein